MADSRVREAMAQAESIADNIAFQVNESYRRLVTARLGIEDARPAVEQAGSSSAGDDIASFLSIQTFIVRFGRSTSIHTRVQTSGSGNLRFTG